jgi:hypothetical protein
MIWKVIAQVVIAWVVLAGAAAAFKFFIELGVHNRCPEWVAFPSGLVSMGVIAVSGVTLSMWIWGI